MSCLCGLPRCPSLSTAPAPAAAPRQEAAAALHVCRAETQQRQDPVPVPQPPCTHESFISSHQRTALTLTSSSLNQVAVSRSMSPSWDSWRNPDSEPSGAQWAPSLQSTASGDLARSKQPGEEECLPPPPLLPRGRGCRVNNKLRGEEGGTEVDRSRGEARGEEERARASTETEQWSDSWGYICDDSDSSTHRLRRAHTGAHTPQALAAAAGRAALTLETLTFQWKKRPVD